MSARHPRHHTRRRVRESRRQFRWSRAVWVLGLFSIGGIVLYMTSQAPLLYGAQLVQHASLRRYTVNRNTVNRDTVPRDTADVEKPLVTANFDDPSRPANPRFQVDIESCRNEFIRTMYNLRYDQRPGSQSLNDTLFEIERWWIPLPPPAISAMRTCMHRLYPTAAAIPAQSLNVALRVAIAMNADSLVPEIVSRKLALIGSDASVRAAFLDTVVSALFDNRWTASGVETSHLTAAHVALARRYTQQLEAMRPVGLVHWIQARNEFGAYAYGRRALSVNDAELDSVLAEVRHDSDVIRATPESAILPSDRDGIKMAMTGNMLEIHRLTFLKSLDRSDLLRFVAARDSVLKGGAQDLLGKAAPPLVLDYWFGTQSGLNATDTAPHRTTEPVPAPGKLSLIVFVNPAGGNAVGATGDKLSDAFVRRLHVRFPTLQITLVATTQGSYGNETLTEHPEREATLMYRFLRDSLHMPGRLGVLSGQYTTVAEGHVLPKQPALLDQYMMDVRDITGIESGPAPYMFLVTPDGWVAWRGNEESRVVPLIQRFLARMPGTR